MGVFGCLLVVCGHSWLLFGGLCSFVGDLWSFASRLWSFVVVACFSNYALEKTPLIFVVLLLP